MDERLNKALEFSTYKETYRVKQEELRAEVYNKLLYSFNGGQFKITPELLNFISVELLVHKQEDLVIIDVNNNPIFVENLKSFYEDIRNIYWDTINNWQKRHEELRNLRNNKKILELEID